MTEATSNYDPFAAAKLQDSLRGLIARMDALQVTAIDHVISESLTSGDLGETLTIRWQRKPPPAPPPPPPAATTG